MRLKKGLKRNCMRHDDSWCADEPPEETSGAELIREQKRRHYQFFTMGYRDGISAGIEASAQEGFNMGFKQSAQHGYKWGNARGITSAFASLSDDAKKKFEDEGKFHSLYESISCKMISNSMNI